MIAAVSASDSVPRAFAAAAFTTVVDNKDIIAQAFASSTSTGTAGIGALIVGADDGCSDVQLVRRNPDPTIKNPATTLVIGVKTQLPWIDSN